MIRRKLRFVGCLGSLGSLTILNGGNWLLELLDWWVIGVLKLNWLSLTILYLSYRCCFSRRLVGLKGYGWRVVDLIVRGIGGLIVWWIVLIWRLKCVEF